MSSATGSGVPSRSMRGTYPLAPAAILRAMARGRAGGSLWMETTHATSYPSLDRDLTLDVAVLGAGIAGLTTALLLERDGASVAVVEASEVAAGATGHTTPKGSSQHRGHHQPGEARLGGDGARADAGANQAAVEGSGG